MNTQSLDALLTDRALDELTPEVRELLAAYLALDPAAARRNEQLGATLTLARQAVALPRESLQSPRSNGPRLSRWGWTAPGWRPVGRFSLLAACLVVGVAAGWFGRSLRSESATVASLAATRWAPSLARAPVGAVRRAPDFWSTAYLSKHQGRPPGPARAKEEFVAIPWERLGQ